MGLMLSCRVRWFGIVGRCCGGSSRHNTGNETRTREHRTRGGGVVATKTATVDVPALHANTTSAGFKPGARSPTSDTIAHPGARVFTPPLRFFAHSQTPRILIRKSSIHPPNSGSGRGRGSGVGVGGGRLSTYLHDGVEQVQVEAVRGSQEHVQRAPHHPPCACVRGGARNETRRNHNE